MSEQTNQREATYNAIKSVLIANAITFEDGMNVKESLSSDFKKEVKTILFEGFRNNSISMSDKAQGDTLPIDSKLNTYCNGLISNWTKKDKRLNGNVKHVIKNKGSRAGQGDEQVKELRKLLKQVTDPTAAAEVQTALDARVAQVKAEKTPSLVINADAIPEHLKHLVK
jgi:hypothetical protein